MSAALSEAPVAPFAKTLVFAGGQTKVSTLPCWSEKTFPLSSPTGATVEAITVATGLELSRSLSGSVLRPCPRVTLRGLSLGLSGRLLRGPPPRAALTPEAPVTVTPPAGRVIRPRALASPPTQGPTLSTVSLIQPPFPPSPVVSTPRTSEPGWLRTYTPNAGVAGHNVNGGRSVVVHPVHTRGCL